MNTNAKEEEEIDDNYEDEEIIDINDYIQIIEKPMIIQSIQDEKNNFQRIYTCECQKCLEFIPNETKKQCIDCGCDLIFHLRDETLYEFSDFEVNDLDFL